MSLVNTGDVKIYRNDQALGPAFLAHQARLANDPAQALAAISDQSFDPSATAVVEADASPAPSSSLVSRIIRRVTRLLPPTLPPQPPAPDQVSVLEHSPEHTVVQTQSSRDGFLVVTDAFYPGWQVTVDGRPDQLYATDYLFRGVHLPAGSHRVELSYAPQSLQVGMAISILALVGVAACLGLAFVLRTRHSNRSRPQRFKEPDVEAREAVTPAG
jgi:hypothetical protein